jgi:hypothetical protein
MRLGAQMRCGRPGVQQNRMHQDHVSSRPSILDNLKRNPVHLFEPFVESCGTRSRSAASAQIAHVRMPCKGFQELSSLHARRRRILEKPSVDETMRSAEDVHASATRSSTSRGLSRHKEATTGPHSCHLRASPRLAHSIRGPPEIAGKMRTNRLAFPMAGLRVRRLSRRLFALSRSRETQDWL